MSKVDPQHYHGDVQPWDLIIAQDLGFLEGNIIKYICRAGKKDSESKLDDYRKALQYLSKLIHVEASRSPRPSSSVPGGDVSTDSDNLAGRFIYPGTIDLRGGEGIPGCNHR